MGHLSVALQRAAANLRRAIKLAELVDREDIHEPLLNASRSLARAAHAHGGLSPRAVDKILGRFEDTRILDSELLEDEEEV